jgi:hypothetical protein
MLRGLLLCLPDRDMCCSSQRGKRTGCEVNIFSDPQDVGRDSTNVATRSVRHGNSGCVPVTVLTVESPNNGWTKRQA